MSCEKELQEITTALRKKSPYFKEGWNANALQAFIREGGSCVYCGKPLLDTWEAAQTATIDHLLPRCSHPEWGWKVENLVPACAECNHIKRNYDPSEQGSTALVLTEGIRLGLVCKAREKIAERTKANERWEGEFQKATPLFQEAVAQYREHKESAATCLP
jgi:5-methylcytosine-specific restriction endonuclease McrA